MNDKPDWLNLRDGVVDMNGVDGPFPSDGRYVRVGELPSEGCKWTDEQCMEFLAVAMRHVGIKGNVRMEEIRQGVNAANRLTAIGDKS